MSYTITYPSLNSTDTRNFTYTDSDPLKDCLPLRVYPVLISAGFVGFCVILGNSLVILAIAGGNSKFFRPMYWFIIYLSCSDLLVGFMVMYEFCVAGIFDIHISIKNIRVLHGLWVTSACSSMLGISLLSADRYMQVVHRSLYSRYFNPCNVGIAILFAVFIPVFVFFVAPIAFDWSCAEECQCFRDKYMECLPISDCSVIIPPFKKSYILGCVIFTCLLIPWPITMYSLIYVKARKATQVVHTKMKQRDFRLIQTLVVILVAYLVTSVPCTVVMIVDYLAVNKEERLVDYALYVFLLTALNSLANPVLYIWRIPAIRLSLQQKVCCFCLKPNSQAGAGDSRITKTESRHFDGPSFKRETPPLSPGGKRQSFWFFRDWKFTPSLSDGSRCSSPDVDLKVKKKFMKRHRNQLNHHLPNLRLDSMDLNSAEVGLSPLVHPDTYQESSFSFPVVGEREMMTSCESSNSAAVLVHDGETRERGLSTDSPH